MSGPPYLSVSAFFRPSRSDENPDVQTLTADHARGLRLHWLSRYNTSSLAGHLAENPGLSLWVPGTGEYLLAERWRRRSDIAGIVELNGRKGRPALIRELIGTLQERGYRLALFTDDVWHSYSKGWPEVGFGVVERIVFFRRELKDKLEPNRELPSLHYRLLTLADLDLALHLDHASFPWLWWNSREELEFYMQMPRVFVYAAFLNDSAIGYSAFTLYDSWAHLDRLAVVAGMQGRRFGAAQLDYALKRMVEFGAGWVALSTQQNNTQSHRLYKAFQFHRTRESMTLYGRHLEGGNI